MPKRIVDGEGLWRADKLLQVELRWRAEYANLLPLALANGTFELNARRIWSQVYAYNRPDVTPEDVSNILASLEDAKLLFRWADKTTGKEWGYWTGSREKPGRLPPPSRLGIHEPVGPEPPVEALLRFTDSKGQPLASQTVTNGQDDPVVKDKDLTNSLKTGGQPKASQAEAKGCLGLGLGLGSGMGRGADSVGIQEPQPVEPQKFNSTEVAQILCNENGWSGKGVVSALSKAIEFRSKWMPEVELEQVGEGLVKEYLERRSAKGDFAGFPQKFFEQGLTIPSELKSNILLDNPATRAQAQMEAS